MNNESDRIKKSSLNVSANMIIYLLQSILSFVVRTFFIKKLGEELLGLDNLLINVLSMLSIAELGFSTAISYGLYKPLADNKIKKINAYMSFYKKVYKYIGFIIIICGLLLSLFLPKIIGNCEYKYVYLVYFLYLFNTASLYFISYKDVLLFADQKNYKIFKYNCFFNSLIYVLQILMLLYYPNYLLYIIIMILCKLFNRVIVNRFISKYYNDVDFNSKDKLETQEIDAIKENVFGLFFYKIGDYIINCTDNIIISSMINIVTVGVYTNYLSITTILKSLIKNLFNGITASFGNLSAQNNKEGEKNVFEIMVFLCFFVGGYVTICLLNLINPFIEIWIGKKFVLSNIAMILICINFYLTCNQMPLDTVKEAKGFYKKDKYIPLIQSIINILLSIIFALKFKLVGILIGTTISYLITVFWNKPYVLYKYVFKSSNIKYFINQIKYIFTIIFIYFFTSYILSYLNLNVNLFNLIVSGIIITFIYFIIISILFFYTGEYKFFVNYVKNIMKKCIKH